MVRRPLCVLCLTGVMLMFVWLLIKGPPQADLSGWTGRKLLIHGTVSGKENRGETQVLYLRNVTFSDMDALDQEYFFSSTNYKNDSYGVIVYLSETLPAMGADIILTGKLTEFRMATNPGEFDLRQYYLLQGYCGKIESAEIVQVSEQYNIWKEEMYRLRCYLSSVLALTLEEQDASVMRAMLLGEKSQMDKDVKALYQASGIAHILAISGLHISIIGMGLYQCLKKLAFPRAVCAGISLFVMMGYAVMTGESTSAIRAVIMFGFAVLAGVFHKSYDLLTALAVAAFCTAVSEPFVLLQPGYWMSYLAVFGVSVLQPAVMRDITINNKNLKTLCNTLSGGICVNLATLPVLLMNYYEYPLYSVLINLLVLPLMGILVTAGLFTMTVGCVFLPAARLSGWMVHGILWFYERICNSMMLPGHSWIAGAPGMVRVGFFYLILFVVIFSGQKIGRKRIRKISPAIRVILILCCILIMGSKENSGLRITFLDVGQGDGICIQTKELVCMIDGGSSSKRSLSEYQLEPFLKYEGISEIDYWFITHPDKDHCSGFSELLEAGVENGITIHTLVLPKAYDVENSCSELIDLANAAHINILFLSAGEYIVSGHLKLTVLHPASGFRSDELNEISLVLSVEYDNFCGIFTGDATAACEAQVMEYQKEQGQLRPVQVLKVGHHGSATSTSDAFLDFCKPQYAVISYGKNNYGHPASEVVERLEAYGCIIYRTMESGAVTVWTDGKRMEIVEFLQQRNG